MPRRGAAGIGDFWQLKMRYFLKNALIRVPASLVSFVLVALLCMTSHAIANSAGYSDQIIVKKGERKLYLMRDGKVLKWYWIALGRSPVGSKIKNGDGRTPEGSYKITGRDRESQFYRALWLSYPNQADRQRAAELGVNPGAGIMIHALPEGYGPKGPGARMIDWTDGCIAVTNTDMDEIWSRVGDGTSVEILP